MTAVAPAGISSEFTSHLPLRVLDHLAVRSAPAVATVMPPRGSASEHR